MDTAEEYAIVMEILQYDPSGEKWDTLRQGKGDWPRDQRGKWKQYRNYSTEQLMKLMIVYEQTTYASDADYGLLYEIYTGRVSVEGEEGRLYRLFDRDQSWEIDCPLLYLQGWYIEELRQIFNKIEEVSRKRYASLGSPDFFPEAARKILKHTTPAVANVPAQKQQWEQIRHPQVGVASQAEGQTDRKRGGSAADAKGTFVVAVHIHTRFH